MAKMGSFGSPIFNIYTKISTKNMYRFIKIRYNILIKCHENYMLEIVLFF